MDIDGQSPHGVPVGNCVGVRGSPLMTPSPDSPAAELHVSRMMRNAPANAAPIASRPAYPDICNWSVSSAARLQARPVFPVCIFYRIGDLSGCVRPSRLGSRAQAPAARDWATRSSAGKGQPQDRRFRLAPFACGALAAKRRLAYSCCRSARGFARLLELSIAWATRSSMPSSNSLAMI